MDLVEIKKKIAEDKARKTSSYRRYPVRFLFMELNNNTQDEIMDLVKSGNGELLELSDYIMKKDDGWLTKSRFIHVIKEHVSSKKDTYVIGFSEMIRFYSRKEIESTVLSLFDIENTNILNPEQFTRRIYIICFSMMDNVYNVLQKSFSRFDLLDPFINSDYEPSEITRQICFVSDEYADSISYNKITTSVDWIGLWRNSQIIDFTKPIWCCSASLYEWHKKAAPDNAFQIDVVENTKQYLQKIMRSDVGFVYELNDDSYWKMLLKDYENVPVASDIKRVIGLRLGLDLGKMEALVAKYVITDDQYEKWLIKNYVLCYAEESFFSKILVRTTSNSSRALILNVWLEGYRISNPSMLRERLAIIRELNKYAESVIPEVEIKNEIISGVAQYLDVSIAMSDAQYGFRFFEICKINAIEEDEFNNKLSNYYFKVFKPAYTGISKTEKEFLINLYSNGFLNKEDLKTMYPSFYSYMFGLGDNLIESNVFFKVYLDEYRKSKVKDKDTPYIEEYYKDDYDRASKLYELYYETDKQDVAVDEAIDDNTDVYVIDGLGAEYLLLVIDLLSRNQYEIESCNIASAHLPSITDVNKAYLAKIPYKKWIVDFDRDVIHGEYYHTTVNLRKAFDTLERIIKEITLDSYGRRIIITADHGATARARWVDTKKKYDYSQADHEGRCCKIVSKADYENNNDYIVYEDEINPETIYLISLNEVSLYNRPKYEDHGGATLEELLVPVIVANPLGTKTQTDYKVIGDKLQVSGLDKTISFVIKPNPDAAVVVENDGTRHDLKKVGLVYKTELASGKVQAITVQIEDKSFNFMTENAARKNMEGDDGFDD